MNLGSSAEVGGCTNLAAEFLPLLPRGGCWQVSCKASCFDEKGPACTLLSLLKSLTQQQSNQVEAKKGAGHMGHQPAPGSSTSLWRRKFNQVVAKGGRWPPTRSRKFNQVVAKRGAGHQPEVAAKREVQPSCGQSWEGTPHVQAVVK